MINELYKDFARPTLAVDSVILRLHQDKAADSRKLPKKRLQILLVKEHGESEWQLPGSMMHIDETPTDTLNRILEDKVGAENVYFEQLYTVADDLYRDPRGRVVSMVYIGIVNKSVLNNKNDRYDSAWFYIDEHIGGQLKLMKMNESISVLKYDHIKIVKDALERIRGKLMYSDIAFRFVGKTFTIRELQDTFELILGKNIPAFRRYINDKIEPTDRFSDGGAFRPAQLFIRKEHLEDW